MAKSEPRNSLLASSLDNFYIFQNDDFKPTPYVNITINNLNATELTIQDSISEQDYKLVISGGSSFSVSDTTYRTAVSTQATMYSLIECLKRNNMLFYDITILSSNSFRIKLDTSRAYSIYCNNSALTISGTYSTYVTAEYPKFSLMLQGDIDDNTTTIPLDKYNNQSTVSFNVTEPFERISFKRPITLHLYGYEYYDGVTKPLNITRNVIKILPTTLTKFEDVNYNDYYYSTIQNTPKKWLTTNLNRKYNYGEIVGLSFLSDTSEITVKHKYYTNSGMYLTSLTGASRIEYNDIRKDFYLQFDLDAVEANYHHQVGYVELVAMYNNTEVSNTIRYTVKPKCRNNHTLFFLNKLGGVDSFNFSNEAEYTSKITNNTTSYRNPLAVYDEIYEIERKQSLKNEVHYKYNDTVDYDCGLWLNELSKSKYVYLYLDNIKPYYMMVLIDDMNITLNDEDDRFDVQVEFHKSDGEITI